MKRPSFQFYPDDWAGNSNLKRCTRAEKGLWIDLLCLFHDQDEYGVLRWSLKEISTALGCKISELRSLAFKGVLKGNDDRLDEAFVYTPRSGRRNGEPVELLPKQQGPIWFCSRMVRDEYVRSIRGESSRFASSNHSPKQSPIGSPKPPFGDGSPSPSPSPNDNSLSDSTTPPRDTLFGADAPEVAEPGTLLASVMAEMGATVVPGDAPAMIAEWQRRGADPDEHILPAVRRVVDRLRNRGAAMPTRLKYFDQAIAEEQNRGREDEDRFIERMQRIKSSYAAAG